MAVVGPVGIAGGRSDRSAGLGLESARAERRQDGGRREGEARTHDRPLEENSPIRQRVNVHAHLLLHFLTLVKRSQYSTASTTFYCLTARACRPPKQNVHFRTRL